jgi:GDP-L-fucose synthase
MGKVLITGGCGFVGRHFCKRLVELGWEVHVVDNLSSESSLPIHLWPGHLTCDVNFCQMDCIDYFKNCTANFDLVIHLAAIVGGRSVIENQPMLVGCDLCIDAQFFKWVVDTKPGKVVYFSSSAAYPISLQVEKGRKLCESDLDISNLSGVPDLTYGWGKLTGEFLAKIAHEKHGIDIVCYRPFSGYGEDQHESYPFPSILERVLNNENPVEIWSDCYRDFVHIEDIVDCVLVTMDQVNDGKAINICSGVETSFSDLVKVMKDCAGIKGGKIKVLNDMPKGVYYRVGDPTLVQKMGWKPKISLQEGISYSIAKKTDSSSMKA